MAGVRGVYKGSVQDKVKDYKNEMNGWLRAWMQTNPDRHARINILEEHRDKNDIIYLFLALGAAYSIVEDNSSFRNKVGKEAALQMSHFFFGLMESVVLLSALRNLLSKDISGVVIDFVILLLIDQLDKCVQLILKQDSLYKKVFDAIQEGVRQYREETKALLHAEQKQVIVPAARESFYRVQSNVTLFAAFSALTTLDLMAKGGSVVVAHDFKQDGQRLVQKWDEYRKRASDYLATRRQPEGNHHALAAAPAEPLPAVPKMNLPEPGPVSRRRR